MTATLDKLLARLKNNPEDIDFQAVMTAIAENYDYTPAQFSNGLEHDRIFNHAGENEGSCKIFAFAQLHGLTEHETLACFDNTIGKMCCNIRKLGTILIYAPLCAMAGAAYSLNILL